MRTATLISLGASAVLGIGALVVAKVWLPQSAHGAPAATPSLAGLTPVVIARADIPYGAKLDAGRLQLAELPLTAVPKGAYSSIRQIVGEAGGPPIVLTPISAREPILASKLSGAGAKATVAAVIADGKRAYTIAVNDVAGGGGHILPGDRVDVVLTYDLSAIAGDSTGGKRLMSTVVLQDVRVLGMDLNADPSSTQAAVAHTATLEVGVQDAEKLALAGQAGTLTLALRRTGAAEITPVHMINVSEFGAPLRLPAAAKPPAVPDRRPSFPRPMAPDGRSVIVVHGDAASAVQVPFDGAGS